MYITKKITSKTGYPFVLEFTGASKTATHEAAEAVIGALNKLSVNEACDLWLGLWVNQEDGIMPAQKIEDLALDLMGTAQNEAGAYDGFAFDVEVSLLAENGKANDYDHGVS